MFKNIFETHQYKIMFGAPIIFLLLINSTGVMGTGNIFLLSEEKNSFPIVGDVLNVQLEIYMKTPVNAVGGTITFPKDILQVDSIARDSSIVDLWSEDPVYSNELGTVHFSGGILTPTEDAVHHGTIFFVNLRALKAGKATLAIENGQLLANDGEGTNVFTGANTLTLYVRDPGKPSPDINGDGMLSISDVNLLYVRTFRAYNEHNDINGDGKVSWADVKALLALL